MLPVGQANVQQLGRSSFRESNPQLCCLCLPIELQWETEPKQQHVIQTNSTNCGQRDEFDRNAICGGFILLSLESENRPCNTHCGTLLTTCYVGMETGPHHLPPPLLCWIWAEYKNCSDTSRSLHLCERNDCLYFCRKTLSRKQIILIVQQQPERNLRRVQMWDKRWDQFYRSSGVLTVQTALSVAVGLQI